MRSLEGKPVALSIKKWVASEVQKIQGEHGWSPTLVTVQIGENLASERYINSQIKACEEAGIKAKFIKYPEDIKKVDFLKEIDKIAKDNAIDGIIVQTPLPQDWKMSEIINAISPDKDVEGVHPENLGRLYLGEEGTPKPCTAWAALTLLEWHGYSSFEEKNCVVVGRSANVGRAVANMLMHKNGTVAVCHTKTSEKQLKKMLSTADVVVVAAGVPGIVKTNELTQEAWVIDVGTNFDPQGKLVGDVLLESENDIEAISPVPGGVGPITVSLLLVNLLLCATKRRLGNSLIFPKLSDLR